MDSHILESVVSNWLWSVAKDALVTKRRNTWPDFELRDATIGRILMELKASPPSEPALKQMAEKLHALYGPSVRFLLITPTAPKESELERFRRAFIGHQQAEWQTLEDLPPLLGKPFPGPWDSPKTWLDLQTGALISGLEAYKTAPIGPDPYATKKPKDQLEALARQFPYNVISQLEESPETLESGLGLGSRRENVTVVLSDLVNFSSLVTASRPDNLKEAMGEYYQLARQAVFDHGGMLDKFIGDAVLAVFGYPEPSADASCRAIRFAQALITIGRNVMESWQAELDAVIPTGTRVGIANGDIWPINIGTSGIEVTLLGDTINVAARLEKKCAPDKLLISNRTYTAGQRSDPVYIASLNLQSIIIEPADAKGQSFPIRAWTEP